MKMNPQQEFEKSVESAVCEIAQRVIGRASNDAERHGGNVRNAVANVAAWYAVTRCDKDITTVNGESWWLNPNNVPHVSADRADAYLKELGLPLQ